MKYPGKIDNEKAGEYFSRLPEAVQTVLNAEGIGHDSDTQKYLMKKEVEPSQIRALYGIRDTLSSWFRFLSEQNKGWLDLYLSEKLGLHPSLDSEDRNKNDERRT